MLCVYVECRLYWLNKKVKTHQFHSIKQECIPVGCVPLAAVAISGGRFPHLPPNQPLLDQALPPGPGTPPRTRHPQGPGNPFPRPVTPLWAETLTHATENITLPQTSFAGSNNDEEFQTQDTCLLI